MVRFSICLCYHNLYASEVKYATHCLLIFSMYTSQGCKHSNKCTFFHCMIMWSFLCFCYSLLYDHVIILVLLLCDFCCIIMWSFLCFCYFLLYDHVIIFVLLLLLWFLLYDHVIIPVLLFSVVIMWSYLCFCYCCVISVVWSCDHTCASASAMWLFSWTLALLWLWRGVSSCDVLKSSGTWVKPK